MNIVTLDLVELKRKGLTINEYLSLVKICKFQNEKFDFDVTERNLESLRGKGYLRKDHESGKLLVTDKTLDLFNESDLFEEFYGLFPHTVTDGRRKRVLSSTNPNTNSASLTKKIWNKLTKKDKKMQEQIIRGLKIELEHRYKEGSLIYMKSIDSWLRGYTWEKWLDFENSSETQDDKIDYL